MYVSNEHLIRFHNSMLGEKWFSLDKKHFNISDGCDEALSLFSYTGPIKHLNKKEELNFLYLYKTVLIESQYRQYFRLYTGSFITSNSLIHSY